MSVDSANESSSARFERLRGFLRPSPLLFRYLLLPSLVISVVLFAVSFLFESSAWVQDFFMELGATFIGIPVTVWFVDEILGLHERQRWAKIVARADHHLERIANSAVINYRIALSRELTTMTNIHDAEERLGTLARFAEMELMPALEGLSQVTREGWTRFMSEIDLIITEAEKTLLTYGNRMSPESQELIIEMLKALESVDSTYQIYRDFLCAPDEPLPTLRSDSIPASTHRKVAIDLAIGDGRNVLIAAVEIERALITKVGKNSSS